MTRWAIAAKTAPGRALLIAALAPAAVAHATQPPAPALPAPPHALVRPAAPLPMLPSIARIQIEPARDAVVLLEEVNLPRDEWKAGGLDLYVAFGAPGAPLAIDAHLVAGMPGALETRLEDPGESLAVEPATRCTANAQLLLGRPQMAGVVVHVRETELLRVYAASDLAGLRLRSLLMLPAADAQGKREVVVRLGIAGGLPLTIGRVQVLSRQRAVKRAEANLCGPEADPWPLAVTLAAKSADFAASSVASSAIAPAMALRHASDDLCIRWW